MKTKFITLLVISIVPLLISGCTQELREEMIKSDQSITSDVNRIQDITMTTENRLEEMSNLLINMNDRMNTNDTQLSAQITDLQNQVADLKSLETRVSDLETRLEAFDKDTTKKFKVLLDEVLNENQRIVKRIRTIEKEVYGDSAAGGAEDRAPAATMDVGSSSGGATEYVQHKVKPGENLWGIAKNYGVSMDSIAQANRMDSTSAIIRPGQTLNIPKN